MFDIHHGWLRYLPHNSFSLPEIVKVYTEDVTAANSEGLREVEEHPIKVPFCNKGGNVQFTRNLYRFQWPGTLFYERGKNPMEAQIASQDQIPVDFVARMLEGPVSSLKFMSEWLKSQEGTMSLLRILDRRGHLEFKQDLPIPVAYHLAVNSEHYAPFGESGRPVAGIPTKRVKQVLGATFALDENAKMALSYLKWLAESQFHNPIRLGFDTLVRDRLYEKTTVSIVQAYFELLGDYIYDNQTHYWSKEDWKYHWWRMAGYLWWLGRANSGVVALRAGITLPIWELQDKKRPVNPIFAESCPDVIERLEAWDQMGHLRGMSHVTGEEPTM